MVKQLSETSIYQTLLLSNMRVNHVNYTGGKGNGSQLQKKEISNKHQEIDIPT